VGRMLAVAGLCGLLVGCGERPDRGRLATGSEAIVYEPELGEVMARPIGTIRAEGLRGSSVLVLYVGTRVTVIDDPGGAPNRLVRVNVREGKEANEPATIGRQYLRPVPAR
jgi:hypothetical protein